MKIKTLLAIILCCILTASLRVGAATDLNGLDSSESEMRAMIERYSVDRGSLNRFYTAPLSPARQSRMKKFYTEWLDSLGKVPFDRISQSGQVDYILFRNHLEYELRQLDIDEKKMKEIELLIPFAGEMVALEEARRRMEPIDSAKLAALLTRLNTRIDETRRTVEAGLRPDARPGAITVKKTVANRGAGAVTSLRNMLRTWYGFYSGYDPVFTWWVEEPYKTVDQSLANYATFLTEKVVGIKPEGSTQAVTDGRPGGGGRGPGGAGPGGGGGAGGQRPGGGARTVSARPGDASDIIGDPIGREALMIELASEMIPYTPEELIALAKKEMAWCEAEMKKASRELGYGDDWHKALEHIKTLHVEPGKQPQLIRELALEAIEFVEKNNLVTVPPLARESWRMEMMSPERQLVSPFFLGGEAIIVSFPTNTMAHEQKMMSMRGNNIHFSRATVHHELIPGHHLQGFMTARYRPYRNLFSTPFWGEGWALYWEFLLWDMNFAKSPENRIGMLFWRMHRCARIIFSLGFHLEQMTPQECIDLLVKGVGHEPDNATAEVRRSFAGQYGPLYQAAYMLGGLQFYALHRDLVKSGKMANRDFHDAILKEGRIPVEMVRAILTKQKLTRDFKTSWKFYGPNPAG
ncbi:MAG TPA: DUF885 family protein [Blastocatellia bacterium]|nr:DUF885 family protein [Blastocatellia bacterium]